MFDSIKNPFSVHYEPYTAPREKPYINMTPAVITKGLKLRKSYILKHHHNSKKIITQENPNLFPFYF